MMVGLGDMGSRGREMMGFLWMGLLLEEGEERDASSCSSSEAASWEEEVVASVAGRVGASSR